jgi:hypothetical protein
MICGIFYIFFLETAIKLLKIKIKITGINEGFKCCGRNAQAASKITLKIA